MSLERTLVAVVPAHNEGNTVRDVVTGLLHQVSKVVVVDDCSSDATAEEARAAGAVVVRNERNQGYDGSLNAGFAEAARLGAGVIITFDADGEHDALDVPRVIAPILEDRADIVAGQRARTTHFGEKVFSFYTGLRFGIWDPLCGLKAYRREVYDAFGYFDTTRSIGTQLMLAGVRRGFRLAGVPIHTRKRVEGTSRFYQMRFRANLQILRSLIRALLSRYEDKTI